MADYPLHYLASDAAFESLVWDICRDVLGEGVSKFTPGKDGGRDAKFVGVANSFPSKTAPLNGRVIVQAKWTASELASCSDTGFQKQLLNEEAPKAAKLCQTGELAHWIIFTNRKKSGGADALLEQSLLKATGAKTVHIRGREDISGYLRGDEELVRRYHLRQFLPPLRVNPEALRTVVIDLLDFCLLKDVKKEFFMKRHPARFAGFVFFLEIELPAGGFITLRRGTPAE